MPITAAPADYQSFERYEEWLVPGGCQWFRNASFGRLDIEVARVDHWYRMCENDDAYGFQRGITSEQHTRYIQEAVNLAAADVDYTAYDMVYIVPAKNASGITFSPTFIAGNRHRVEVNGHALKHAVTFGQDMWKWGFKVLNHETLHICGLPDLYAFEDKGDPPNGHYYVGGWDVMGLISGHAPEPFAWHKWKLGWLDDDQVDVVTRQGTVLHSLSPLETPGGTKMIVIPLSETSAYTVECRRPLLNDASALDTGVLLSYVDTSVRTGRGPLFVVHGNPALRETYDPEDIDHACLGLGTGQFTTFEDVQSGVVITVAQQSEMEDVIQVTRRHR